MSETSTIETLRMEAAELRQTVQFLKESMAKAEAFIQTARRHTAEHELPKAAEYPAMKTIWTPFGDVVTLEDARLAIAAEKRRTARWKDSAKWWRETAIICSENEGFQEPNRKEQLKIRKWLKAQRAKGGI